MTCIQIEITLLFLLCRYIIHLKLRRPSCLVPQELIRNVLRQVFEFIGLHQVGNETLQEFTSDVYNKRQKGVRHSLRLSDADRDKLSAVFEPYNRALTDLLNWKSVVWK